MKMIALYSAEVRKTTRLLEMIGKRSDKKAKNITMSC